DTGSGALERINVGPNGEQADEVCNQPTISSDGKRVVFGSNATNIVPDGGTRFFHVFVRNLDTDITTIASVDTEGQPAGGGGSRAISVDGSVVAYTSVSPLFVEHDWQQGISNLIIYNRGAGSSAAAVPPGPGHGGSLNDDPRISDDGRFVMYQDAEGVQLFDIQNGVLETMPDDVRLGNLSGDGRLVAYRKLVETRPNPADPSRPERIWGAFVFDRETGRSVRVDVPVGGDPLNDGSVRGDVSISSDGCVVAFSHDSPSLVEGDTNGVADIFVVGVPSFEELE